MAIILCRPRSLPLDKLDVARRRAILINPANAVEERTIALTPVGRRGGPRRIAVLVARKWPATGVKLTVSFMDRAKSDLRKRILLHMNAWGKKANVKFVQTAGTGQVRIARQKSPPADAGYWSYIGTEILEIPEDEPTMNLEGFTMRTPESEFTRVVRHEAGHTLGFEHEHLRSDIVRLIDREKAIAFYEEDQGWPPDEVEAQVLTPLAKKSIMGTTESDPLSIMCYDLPAEIMKNNKAVRGGDDINPRDHAFVASLYPKSGRGSAPVIEVPQIEVPPVDVGTVGPAGPPGNGTSDRAPPADSMGRGREATDVFELVIMDEFRPDPEGSTQTEVRAGVREFPRSACHVRDAAASRARREQDELRLDHTACTSASRTTPTGWEARCRTTRS